MFEGDSLAVLSLLVGAMIGAIIGAIPTPPGRPRTILWGIAGLFALLSLAWLATPFAGPAVQAARAVLAAVVQSGAFIIVGTVSIVALMQSKGRRQALAVASGAGEERAAPRPAFAVPSPHSKWAPDITLLDGASYLASKSRWAKGRYTLLVNDVSTEVSIALAAGKLTAWAKGHPDDDQWFEVKPYAWDAAELTVDKNYAFFRREGAAGYDVRLSKGELEAAYPPAD